MFTQPEMYSAVSKMKPVLAKYTEQLVAEGVISIENAKVSHVKL